VRENCTKRTPKYRFRARKIPTVIRKRRLVFRTAVCYVIIERSQKRFVVQYDVFVLKTNAVVVAYVCAQRTNADTYATMHVANCFGSSEASFNFEAGQL